MRMPPPRLLPIVVWQWTHLSSEWLHLLGRCCSRGFCNAVSHSLPEGRRNISAHKNRFFIFSNRHWTWHATPTSPIHIRPFNTTFPTTARWFLLKPMCRTKNYAYTLRHQVLWLAHMILKAEFGSLTLLCHWEILYNRAIKIFSCPCWYTKSKSCKIHLFITWSKVQHQHFGRFVLRKSPVLLLGTAQSTGFLLQWCLSQTISFTQGEDSRCYIFYSSILNLAVLFSLLKSPDLVFHTTHMN